jgi:hypothetical protein
MTPMMTYHPGRVGAYLILVQLNHLHVVDWLSSDGLEWLGSALHYSSISLSAGCLGERNTRAGSGGLATAARSIAIR